MNSRLPATPLDALSISGVLKFIVKLIHRSADVLHFWNFPSTKASADFEDMSLIHKIYWGYKSRHPILRAEKNSRLEKYFMKKRNSISLPAHFQIKKRLSFAAVGDLIKVDGIENSKDKLYENVKDLIFEKEICVANLESQLTSQDIGKYQFSDKNTPPLCLTGQQYDVLKGHKGKQFNLLNTACNHTFDVGLEGVETTLDQLEEDVILDLGTNHQVADWGKGRIIEKNGIKIGFLSATYGLNGKEIPNGKEYLVNLVRFHQSMNGMGKKVDLSLIKKQIVYCRQQECDLIIASFHWGYEYEFFPRKHQIEIAHEVVEMGVDVIIGHHPHVLQPIEFYQTRRDPEKVAIIAYSLGNLTTSFSAPHLVLSGILNLEIVKGFHKDQEKTIVSDLQLIPVVQNDDEGSGGGIIQLYRLEDFISKYEKSQEMEAYLTALKNYSQLVIRNDLLK